MRIVNNNLKKILISIIFSLTLLLCGAANAFAAVNAQVVLDEGLQVSQQGVAMTLVSSSVFDNSSDVSLNPTIQLDFSKNVVNFSVLKNNSNCFHLIDAEENPVEIDVIFPDDQLQQEYKRQVFIIPVNQLSPNSEYTLIVDNNLLSKNGTYIDNAYFITFTTGDTLSERQNRILESLGDNIMQYRVSSGKTEYSVKKYTPLVLEEKSGNNFNYTLAQSVLWGMIIFLMAASLVLKKFGRLDA